MASLIIKPLFTAAVSSTFCRISNTFSRISDIRELSWSSSSKNQNIKKSQKNGCSASRTQNEDLHMGRHFITGHLFTWVILGREILKYPPGWTCPSLLGWPYCHHWILWSFMWLRILSSNSCIYLRQHLESCPVLLSSPIDEKHSTVADVLSQ